MVNPIGGTNPVSENQYNPSQQTLTDYNTAITDFNSQNYGGSYASFKDLVTNDKIFPTQHPEVYYYLGLAAQYSNPPEPDAKQFLQDFLNMPNADPSMISSAKGQIDLIDGQTALQNNDYDGALAAYEKAGVDDPSLVPQLASTIGQIKGQVDINNANEAQQNNDIAGMLKWYQQAGVDDPSMAPQLASTIAQLQGQQQWNNEQPAINDLMNQAQNVMYPPNGEQGHPEQAIAILQSALDQYPDIAQNQPSIYFTMAQYAWSGAHTNQASDYFSKFEPSISQIPVQGNESYLASVAYFKTQLDGNPVANWATFGANWLSHHTGISSEWWQNNVLGAAQGVMFNTDGMNNINAKMRFGKHAFINHTAIHGDSDEIATLDKQKKEFEDDLAEEQDSEKKNELKGQIAQIDAEKKQVEAAGNAGGKDVPVSDPIHTERTATRSRTSLFDRKITSQTADSKDKVDATGKVIAKGEGAGEDPSGPGFWGLGTTLQQAQAVYKSFGNVNAVLVQSDPNAGLKDYTIQASGGFNVLNAEERVFNMCYGGPTAAGWGIHDMYGAQARADLIDEQYGLNYAGGDLNIGGQDFSVANQNSLVNSGLSESGAIGSQADVHGGASLGTKGVDLAGNAGAFAGAQTSGQVSANVLGQGGFAMGQAWAGVGAKLNGNIGFGSGGVHFDLGIGAALGVGGYVQISGNLNFEAMGQSIAAIYGTGNHTFTGMAGRTVELAASAASAAGDMVSNVAGSVNSLVGGAQDYFADNAVSNIGAGGVKTLEGIGEGVGEIATDAANIYVTPVLSAAKAIGGVASEVGSDIAKGKIGDALEDTVVGGAKAVWSTAKDVVSTAWHGVENFFHGW